MVIVEFFGDINRFLEENAQKGKIRKQKGFRGATTQICRDNASFKRMSAILATGNPGSVIVPICHPKVT